MVIIAQLVRASDCGSEGRGFESHWSPKSLEDVFVPGEAHVLVSFLFLGVVKTIVVTAFFLSLEVRYEGDFLYAIAAIVDESVVSSDPYEWL